MPSNNYSFWFSHLTIFCNIIKTVNSTPLPLEKEKGLSLSFFFFLRGTGVWTQSLTLARSSHCLRHSTSPRIITIIFQKLRYCKSGWQLKKKKNRVLAGHYIHTQFYFRLIDKPQLKCLSKVWHINKLKNLAIKNDNDKAGHGGTAVILPLWEAEGVGSWVQGSLSYIVNFRPALAT
jgi:hypothetical protein